MLSDFLRLRPLRSLLDEFIRFVANDEMEKSEGILRNEVSEVPYKYLWIILSKKNL